MSVTATIVGRNESSWLKESILSIEPFVDEIIFLDDKSEDNSLKLVKGLQVKIKKLKVYDGNGIPELKNKTLNNYKNFLIDKSSSDWILRWDADFIAYDKGKQNIKNLITFAEQNSNKFDGYILKGPNLSGDIYHQDPNKLMFGPECYFFKRGYVKFIQTNKYIDGLKYLNNLRVGYPQHLIDNDVYFIHMNTLKPIERIVYRSKMTNFQLEQQKSSGYWSWLLDKHNITKDTIIKQRINTPIELIDFDFDRWGQHPEIILKSKNINKFKIIIKDKKYYLDYPKYVTDI